MKSSRFDYGVYRANGCFSQSSDGLSYDGTVITKHGIVAVWSQRPTQPRDRGYTSFIFVYAGRDWRLSVKRFTTPRGMTTMANRFARTVVEENS